MVTRTDNNMGSELANSRTFYGYSSQIRKQLRSRLERLDKLNRKPDSTPEQVAKIKQEIRDLQEFYIEIYREFLDNLVERGAKPKFEIAVERL